MRGTEGQGQQNKEAEHGFHLGLKRYAYFNVNDFHLGLKRNVHYCVKDSSWSETLCTLLCERL